MTIQAGRSRDVRVVKLEPMACDAGWRPYHFLKLSTDDGVVGWSEYDEGFGSPGVTQVIEKLEPLLVGRSVFDHEQFFADAYARTRPAAGGVVGEGLGAIENALLDAKARALGLPVYELLGGKIRDRLRVYWSHCSTYHVNHPKHYQPPVRTLDDVKRRGEAVAAQGFSALKTNWILHHDGPARGWRPGFCAPFYPELNVDRKAIASLRAHLEALRDGAGDDVEILLDLNFNARTEGYLRVLRSLADFELLWVELDLHAPDALSFIRSQSPHPIASCETVIGGRALLPFLQKNALDVAIVDTVWNGAWQSMKMASLADIHEVNVAPHNFYGHLSTMMGAHFAAAVPNFRIMETDIDRISWDDQLFTHAPVYEAGELVVPDRPGWGTEPIEEAIRSRPPTSSGFFMQRR